MSSRALKVWVQGQIHSTFFELRVWHDETPMFPRRVPSDFTVPNRLRHALHFLVCGFRFHSCPVAILPQGRAFSEWGPAWRGATLEHSGRASGSARILQPGRARGALCRSSPFSDLCFPAAACLHCWCPRPSITPCDHPSSTVIFSFAQTFTQRHGADWNRRYPDSKAISLH